MNCLTLIPEKVVGFEPSEQENNENQFPAVFIINREVFYEPMELVGGFWLCENYEYMSLLQTYINFYS